MSGLWNLESGSNNVDLLDPISCTVKHQAPVGNTTKKDIFSFLKIVDKMINISNVSKDLARSMERTT